MTETPFRSGFVCLTGLPSSGKSTLVNHLAGLHLAITSPKPQTTRDVIRVILDQPDSQIIFFDTPGLHQPKTKLGQYMKRKLTSALQDGDLIVLLTDAVASSEAKRGPAVPALEQDLLRQAAALGKPVILVLNKVDRIAKEQLLPLIALYAAYYDFAAIVPLSALTGDGVPVLLEEIRRRLAPGPRYYPEDSLTDQTERNLAAELIREQILQLTSEEIPHSVAVEIEAFEEIGLAEAESGPPETALDPAGDAGPKTAGERQRVLIKAALYCDKDSHKGILIGKNGAMLKRIGTQARLRIEQMTGCPCYLELFVKVREGWRDRQDILRSLGYTVH
jgi:GTP-binding protein Era